MTREYQRSSRRTRLGIAALIIGLSAIDPLTHIWLKFGLPPRMAHTGFHIGDTPFFLTSMRIFQNGFYSPYAASQSPLAAHSIAYFALPHHWLYGAIGSIGDLFRVDPFLWLGMANGVCGAFYLFMVYRFLRKLTPARANLAFAIFSLGGGLGGALYLLNGLWGDRAAPGFESWFHRYARYELIEGPFLSPALLMPRLYYTLPLALGFAALTRFLRNARHANYRPDACVMAMSLLTAYLNARAGMMFAIVALLYLWTAPPANARSRLQLAAAFAAPAALGMFLAALQFRMNPHGAENVGELLRRCAWFGSLLPLLFWHFFTVPPALKRHLADLPPSARIFASAGLGYLAVFAALYFAHQVYFGNLLAGGDTAAAIQVSDYALLGAAAGALYGSRRMGSRRTASNDTAWLALWFLAFLAVAVSAFGRGWFMRFMPERFLTLLGVPLAVLSAEGLTRIRETRPRLSQALVVSMLACGACSLGVAALCFQGPLGRNVHDTAFAWAHSELMAPEDARLIDKIGEGVVLAPASLPPLFGDVIVHRRPKTSTVFGQPSLEFGGIRMSSLGQAVQRFFAPGAANAERRAFVKEWRVEYIYCPSTRPVDPEVIKQFRNSIWLEETARDGAAALFRVRAEAKTPPAQPPQARSTSVLPSALVRVCTRLSASPHNSAAGAP